MHRHKTNMETKEANKTVSLGTSKVNYMDPRITVAWCKKVPWQQLWGASWGGDGGGQFVGALHKTKVDLAIEKVFPKQIRTKFPWAMHFPSSYVFE